MPGLDSSAVLHAAADELEQRYVVAEVGRRAVARLRRVADSAELTDVRGAAELCARATAGLREM